MTCFVLGRISSGGAATHVTVTVQPGNQMSANAAYQRLKVEDALSYLDQVKMQFNDQPQVYNQFLDIMKEFKTQNIDTPGVIGRVSALFDGHPELIRGFNTFLPPGYKIDVQPGGGHPPGHMGHPQGVHGPPHGHHMNHGPPPSYHRPPPHQPSDGRHQQSDASRGKQPVEFNHAINYVNKIKTRFAQQPEIYKAFLEILHTYQKEQRSIKEVYAQVATLFRSHADLLEEFSQFLPEASPSGQQGGSAVPPQQSAQPFVGKGGAGSARDDYHYKKPMPAVKSTLQRMPSSTKSKMKTVAPIPTPTTSVSVAVSKKLKGKVAQDFNIQEAAKAGSYEDFIFFDKVRRALNSKTAYENFLRCINLYTVEILNRAELVSLVQGFIGKYPELMSEFKTFVGYKEPTDSVAKVNAFAKDTWEEIDYTACKRYGCSYRALPKNYQVPVCSGRSKEEKAVLNDVWVSFPTWSEDSTFVTSRKNMFEEALYKCEDERYELDMVRECNICLMKGLDSVNKKIANLTADQIPSFVLDKKLGTRSEVIPLKALSRLYGERHLEVYEAVRNNPVVAVPVVLKRLKAKDEEWQKAQGEWNKIWREVHEKNFMKSADHQALNFKGNDKKAMSAKNVILEIENRYGEEKERLEHEDNPVPKPHLLMNFEDESVFGDVAELLIAHVTRPNSNASSADKEKITNFLTNFIPDFFLYIDGKYPVDIQKAAEGEDKKEEECEIQEGSPRKRVKTEDGCAQAADSVNKVKPVTVSQAAVQSAFPKPNLAIPEVSKHIFFGNNTWMVFFKLYHCLFSRVEKLKSISQKCSSRYEKVKDKVLPPEEEVAIKLSVKKAPEVTPDKYFENFMAKVKKVMEGALDMPSFEDSMRDIFGVSAYTTFTIDKLIQCINRQLQNIISDEACTRLLSLYIYEKARNQEEEFVKTAYRANADGIIGGDENCLSFVHDRKRKVLEVVLLDPEEIVTAPDVSTVEEKWSFYVDKYVKMDPDPSLSEEKIKQPFLSRCKRGDPEDVEEDERLQWYNGLQCKICINTYKIFYVENSSDFMYRSGQLKSAKDGSKDYNKLKSAQFNNWLNTKTAGSVSESKLKDFDAWLKKGDNGVEISCTEKVCENGLTVKIYRSPVEPEAEDKMDVDKEQVDVAESCSVSVPADTSDASVPMQE